MYEQWFLASIQSYAPPLQHSFSIFWPQGKPHRSAGQNQIRLNSLIFTFTFSQSPQCVRLSALANITFTQHRGQGTLSPPIWLLSNGNDELVFGQALCTLQA